MKYSKILQEYIDKSGMTLEEIASACHKKGVKVHSTYVSKLRLGQRPAPSDEISIALAEVTGGDADKLIMAGYYEEAPEEVKKLLNKAAGYERLFESLFKKRPIKVEQGGPERFFDDKELEEMVSYVNSPEYLKTLTKEEQRELLLDILTEMISNNPQGYKEFIGSLSIETNKESITPYDLNAMLRIPVLGSICAGEPVDFSEYNEGFTLVDPNLLRGKEGFSLRVKGDSMSGDRIMEGDIVIVAKQEEVQPHEIAVVAINGEEATLKRVKQQENMVILVSSNPNYEPMLYPAKDIYILGKVVEVKFWPK